MQNDHPPCCCARDEAPSEPSDRRGFLRQAVAIGCGAAALAVPTVAGIVTFIDPVLPKPQPEQGDAAEAKKDDFLRLASLEALPDDGTPLKVSVIAARTDAWSRFPNEPIGAVYLARVGGKSSNKVLALQVVCPHAGCSINYDASAKKYFCPCHAASFDMSGARTDATSPSPRNMDSLDVDIRDKNQVFVKFESFRLGIAEKVVL